MLVMSTISSQFHEKRQQPNKSAKNRFVKDSRSKLEGEAALVANTSTDKSISKESAHCYKCFYESGGKVKVAFPCAKHANKSNKNLKHAKVVVFGRSLEDVERACATISENHSPEYAEQEALIHVSCECVI